MKQGDKVWYFDNYNRVISSAIIKKIDYNILEAMDEYTGMRIGFDEHTLPFPSREALCEHYRKILEQDDNNIFTIRWLSKNVDLADPRFRENSVELYIEDETTEDGLDCGCVDIVYNFQVFWSLCKGTASKEWLCTVDNEFRNDVWIPSVKTRADFKRLFRVAAGFDLPLYMDI